MSVLNGDLFLIILSLLFLLGGIAVGMVSLSQGILFLRAAPARREGWIMPAGSVAWADQGIITLKCRSWYRKFPILSLSVGLDERNREIEKEKWKATGSR